MNNQTTTTVPTQDKTRLISLAQAAEMYGFNQRYLSELARKGKLRAHKLSDIWVTTPADVEEYIRNRKRMGRYRDDIQA